MTTRNLKDAEDPQRYAVFTRNRSIRQGWLPWEWAELSHYAPWAKEKYQVFPEDAWLVKREEIRLEWQKKHEANSAKYKNAWKTVDEAAALQTQQAMTAALKGFMDQVNSPQDVAGEIESPKRARKAKPEAMGE